MAGLNDGYELTDDETQLGTHKDEDHTPPEKIDFSKEMAGLIAFENSVADLTDLAADIEQSAGMSQDLALEAERIMPGVLSAGVKHFTMSPSATRLRISLEEIEKGVWALIAAAVVAIIGIIYKIFKWLSGDKSTDSGDAGKAGPAAVAQLDEQIKAAEEAPEVMQKVADGIGEANDVLKKEGIEVSDMALRSLEEAKASAAQKKLYKYNSFDELIAKMVLDDHKYEVAKKFLESGDPIFHDIITNGDYTKMAQDAGHALLQLRGLIDTKIRLVDEVTKTDIHNTTITAKAANLKILNDPGVKDPIRLNFRGNQMTMEEISRALATMKDGTSKKATRERINFDVLFRRMAVVYKQPVNIDIFRALRESVDHISKLEAKMEDMQRFANNIAHDGHPGSASEGIGVEVRQAILRLGKDVAGYAHLAAELKYYTMDTQYLAKEAFGFGIEIVRKIRNALKTDGQRVPEDWEKAMNSVAKDVEYLKGLFAKSGPRRGK